MTILGTVDSTTGELYDMDAALAAKAPTADPTFTGDLTVGTDVLSAEPATIKTVPVDADTLTLWDSAASFVRKKLSWANIKATLLTYFSGKFANDNLLINGNFAVAQRGTTFNAALNNNNDGDYNLDGWYLLTEGADTVDVSQSNVAPEGIAIGAKSVVLEVETVGDKFGQAQIVEASKSMESIGNDVTFSFYAKVSSTRIDTVKAAIVSWQGTADTVTRDIVSTWNADGTTPTLIANATFENTPVALSVTTDFARYSVTANIDTASTKNLILFVWSDDATSPLVNDQLYIANAKAEVASEPSRFVPEKTSTNLENCRRLYRVLKSFIGNASGSTALQGSIRDIDEMRVTVGSGLQLSVTGPLRISDENTSDYSQSTGAISSLGGNRVRIDNFTGLTANRSYIMFADATYPNSITLNAQL